ncbi:DUF2848 domain-containing protein [Ramlibacter sp. 2FC]|uniref:DUF2848 domain-containing protein n=1 Tax=Ramlibacter sp. 2FC TaxID=2502188 RepID=UPI0010F6AC75|nr:DUF2848 domain-containing protein [Ramlibacter sp. 2FC]
MLLTFELDSGASLQLNVEHLVIAGWTGRDTAAIEHHIEELAVLGVPPPSSVPLYYRVANHQLSQSPLIEVVGEQSSGEVEPLVFRHDGQFYLSIASDHTDRELESHSVALSKQICSKPAARQAWRLDEVAERWDSLEMASWIVEDGREVLYQQGTLAALRSAKDLLALYESRAQIPQTGFAMTCGTLPAIGGIRPAAEFRMALRDPATGRTINHAYRCRALPVVA